MALCENKGRFFIIKKCIF
ncbi:hypothetical protein DW054_08665 [Dorea formicigenerans]|uniref:Uncharacterized protein n=1 Tax=Dorea formicigenerans TaxID=39486 RepID=A0A415H687_9FIRM|nr:hypothetical protein DW054_08665 [Dorea formicigenerans]